MDYERTSHTKKPEVIKENYFPVNTETTQQLTEEVENNETEIVEKLNLQLTLHRKLKRHNNKFFNPTTLRRYNNVSKRRTTEDKFSLRP